MVFVAELIRLFSLWRCALNSVFNILYVTISIWFFFSKFIWGFGLLLNEIFFTIDGDFNSQASKCSLTSPLPVELCQTLCWLADRLQLLLSLTILSDGWYDYIIDANGECFWNWYLKLNQGYWKRQLNQIQMEQRSC